VFTRLKILALTTTWMMERILPMSGCRAERSAMSQHGLKLRDGACCKGYGLARRWRKGLGGIMETDEVNQKGRTSVSSATKLRD